MPSHKIERISSDIQKYLSDIIANEARDELLKTITVTACKVTNDLSFCKVYFTSMSELEHKQLEKELNEAAPFLRGKLAERLEIRHIPALVFVYDDSIAYGEKIENIIKNLGE